MQVGIVKCTILEFLSFLLWKEMLSIIFYTRGASKFEILVLQSHVLRVRLGCRLLSNIHLHHCLSDHSL